MAGELERVRAAYEEAIEGFEPDCGCAKGTECMCHWKTSGRGEAGPIALKFLSLFHGCTVEPYSFLPGALLGTRAQLLYTVQSWLLERFYEKCQFEVPPLHTSIEAVALDVAIVNSLLAVRRVLRDDWGESLVSTKEMHVCVY